LNSDYKIEQLTGSPKLEEVSHESNAFLVLRRGILVGRVTHNLNIENWMVNEEAIEIQSLHEWWISEKILSRKRIVFRVIGNDEVGMGHIYRAKSLAHEMHDHEVIFVTDNGSEAAVRKLVGSEYRVYVFPWGEIVNRVIELSPDLVINDMLDTNTEDINTLSERKIRVVNFEDLGTGASVANLTINELYDNATISGNNMRWGYDYFFVREEFEYAEPRPFDKNVTAILLTFGGTDQHNMSQAIYQAVWELCNQLGIAIHVVTGPGYAGPVTT
jgi:spore coat polysaccharide biosynthesis predicted glycosyltransferase SpsG